MGGNALRHLDVQRISIKEYISRMEWFIDNICSPRIAKRFPGVAFEFPVILADKEDIGDLDIVYTCPPHLHEELLETLKQEFNSKGFVKNGNCTSIEWNNLQVDFIYNPNKETMEWAALWYSHGDFMAIIGRVYRYYHFILKNNGLYFAINTPNLRQEIELTQDWAKTFNILKYKPLSRYHLYQERDIYEYVFSSPFAFPGLYFHVKTERKIKRPMQKRFYEWLETQPMDVKYPRKQGWQLLYEFDKKAYWRARRIQVKLWLKELVFPIKRVYKKTWNKKLKPIFYSMVGRPLDKSKRYVK